MVQCIVIILNWLLICKCENKYTMLINIFFNNQKTKMKIITTLILQKMTYTIFKKWYTLLPKLSKNNWILLDV